MLWHAGEWRLAPCILNLGSSVSYLYIHAVNMSICDITYIFYYLLLCHYLMITSCIKQLPSNGADHFIHYKSYLWLLRNQKTDGDTEEYSWRDERILYYEYINAILEHRCWSESVWIFVHKLLGWIWNCYKSFL